MPTYQQHSYSAISLSFFYHLATQVIIGGLMPLTYGQAASLLQFPSVFTLTSWYLEQHSL